MNKVKDEVIELVHQNCGVSIHQARKLAEMIGTVIAKRFDELIQRNPATRKEGEYWSRKFLILREQLGILIKEHWEISNEAMEKEK